MSIALILDTNVVSYLYKGGPLGAGYLDLIGSRQAGITLLSLAELRTGVIRANWGNERVKALEAVARRFIAVAGTAECLACVARSWPTVREWVGRSSGRTRGPLPLRYGSTCRSSRMIRISKEIPDLRVLTLHRSWRVRDEPRDILFDDAPVAIPSTPEAIAEAEETFAREFRSYLAQLRRSAAERESRVSIRRSRRANEH